MLGQEKDMLHWSGRRAAYLCADMVEVAVRRGTFPLARRHLLGKTE